SLPLLVRPSSPDVDLAAWAGQCRAWIAARLLGRGGILFRGFDLRTSDHFRSFVTELSPALMPYEDQHTPRSHLGGGVYTSTEFPAGHAIELHSEMSYAARWPRKIWFFCVS